MGDVLDSRTLPRGSGGAIKRLVEWGVLLPGDSWYYFALDLLPSTMRGHGKKAYVRAWYLDVGLVAF